MSTSDHEPHWSYDSMAERVRTEGVPYCGTWRIHYSSGSGELTVRTIDVSHVLDDRGQIYVLARCRLRGEERTFRAERIAIAYDMQTMSRIPSVSQLLFPPQRKAPAIAPISELPIRILSPRRLTDAQRTRLAELRESARTRAKLGSVNSPASPWARLQQPIHKEHRRRMTTEDRVRLAELKAQAESRKK